MEPTESIQFQTRSAVTANKDGEFLVSYDMPMPQLRPDSAIVRTEAFAINPSDTKMLGGFQTPGAILGTDYAGTVVAVGANLQSRLQVGDRVCGPAHGMNRYHPEQGAFATYVMTEGELFLKIPSHMSTEEGASLCAGLCTVGLALRALGLPMPDNPAKTPFKVLVYGASTASGSLAMQILRLSNLIPIATCSPKNFDLVASYGAEKAFDYHETTCAQDIRNYTQNNLSFTIDCITTVESTSCCYEAIGRTGGKYVSLDPYPEHAATRKVVKPQWILGPTVFGQDIGWPEPYQRPGDEKISGFAVHLFLMLQQLLDEGKLRSHPLRILKGGFDKIFEGMKLIKNGNISGEKIVVSFEVI